jgi:hypothetical protein
MRRFRMLALRLAHDTRPCVLGFGLALCFALGPVLPVSAQADGAVVRPEPRVLEIGEGQLAMLEVVLENAAELYGVDVRASFDPEVVEVLDADPTKDGVQMIPGSFLKPDFVVRNLADNKAGTLLYVLTQVNPTPPASGTGVLFSVRFRGKAAGRNSDLKVASVEMADRHGVKLKVQPQDGTIRVVGTPILVATPGPVAAMAAAVPTQIPATPSSTPRSQPAPATPSIMPTQPERGRTPVSETPTPDPPAVAAPELDKPGGSRVGWILAGACVLGLGAIALWVLRRTRRSQGGQG